ncbi:hypothetical protein COF80_27035 [Bacillus toyonensis]|nr:hypothetical protein COF80_27035 [Bacillus toyonensis]
MRIFSEPYHANTYYFGIHKCFLDSFFNHIDTIGDNEKKREFWVKRVAMVAVTESLTATIKELNFKDRELEDQEIIEEIQSKMSNELNNLLPKALYYNYTGSSSQNKATYEGIQKYIYINRKLESQGIQEPSTPELMLFINRYIELNKEELENAIEEEGNLEELSTFINNVETNKERLISLSSDDISTLLSDELQEIVRKDGEVEH